MEDFLIKELNARRIRIRSRWIDLLQTERSPSPLGEPVILSHLFDQTLDEILATLAQPPTPAPTPADPPTSQCGCNPLRHYFASLEQALLESLVFAQVRRRATQTDPAARAAAVEEVRAAIRTMATRELSLYDSLCLRRAETPAP